MSNFWVIEIVLFAVVGELGAGKTLSQTFLCWKNWFYRRKPIFSNYHLFKIPYVYVNSIPKLNKMFEGFVGCDELWRIVDSRTTKSEKNRISADILSRSRKRHLTYCFTAQLIDSIDKRVRKVTDFTALPILNADETVCKVIIFRTGYPKDANRMKTFYFKTGLVFNMFDTDEEIDMLEEDPNSEEQIIVFQENYDEKHGYWCQCPSCKTMFFKTWEEADKYAENYWKEKIKDLGSLL